MNKKFKKQYPKIVLLLLIACISLGYGALTSNLTIIGTSNINNASWDVHWNNVQVTNGSVTGTNVTTAAHILTGNTEVEYSITLGTPGDFYEFTVDAVNGGSIDAMIGSFSNKSYQSNGTTERQLPDYLTYTVTYDDDTPLAANHLLSANSTETYKVRVEFKKDISANQLPSSADTLVFKFNVVYVQADSNAISKPIALYTVLKNEAAGNTYAKQYTGNHQDSMAGVGDKAIYHWYASSDDNATAILDKWNVIYGGFCWQMIRTTDTGGVKMIYNGVPSNGQCNNTGDAQQIGTSAFNTNYNSPAYVGYMYNPSTLITYKANSAATSGSLFGTGVTYSGGNYTLTSTSTTYDTTHHYTCNNTTGTCSTVRYYYYNNYYIEISDGRSIEEALEDMLSSDDVNTTDSTIKTIIDAWYQNNMTSYTSKLEDTIFCNDRSITSLGGWNPNGGSKTGSLQFKNYNINSDLSCTNETDKFSLANAKAQLTYPVGLMTSSEMYLLNNANLRKTGQTYWLASPNYFSSSNAYGRYVNANGSMYNYNLGVASGVRPAVSLATGTLYTSGDGSMTNPYIVE